MRNSAMRNSAFAMFFIAATVSQCLPEIVVAQSQSIEQLKKAFEVEGELFVVDASGKFLKDVSSNINLWQDSKGGGLVQANFGSRWQNYPFVGLKMQWQMLDSGEIKVSIEQFDRQVVNEKTKQTEYVDSLGKEDVVIERMMPIVKTVRKLSEGNLIVRLTPRFRPTAKLKNISGLPLTGADVVIGDTKGQIWSMNHSFEGEFIGVSTSKGTLLMSLSPFKEATIEGVAEGNEIRIPIGLDQSVFVRSSQSILPHKIKAKVYAAFLPNLKTEKWTNVHTVSSNTSEDLMKRIQIR
ncbi:MAG: hypothetical protein NT027_01985 [Proteobacteria bacterium]|nr:hypothetical protein [Pseudomonadota bacterium]